MFLLRYIYIYAVVYFRDALKMGRMALDAIRKSKTQEVQDTIIIWSFLIPVILAYPIILMYTSHRKTVRYIRIYE